MAETSFKQQQTRIRFSGFLQVVDSRLNPGLPSMPNLARLSRCPVPTKFRYPERHFHLGSWISVPEL